MTLTRNSTADSWPQVGYNVMIDLSYFESPRLGNEKFPNTEEGAFSDLGPQMK